MRITASRVAEGDIIRGIGLVVVYSEPQDDFHTNLEGRVSRRDPENPGEFVGETTSIILPNDHLVNVRRSDAAFRADMVTDAQSAFEDYLDDGNAHRMHERLTEVANRPRGVCIDPMDVGGVFDQLIETADAPTGEGFVAAIEAINARWPASV